MANTPTPTPTGRRREQTTYALDRSKILRALEAAAELERQAAGHLAAVVDIARILGTSWEDVGQALGVSRQAATKRFGGGASS